MTNLPKENGQNMEKLFKGANPEAIDLLKKLLTYDPEERVSVEDAIGHPYLENISKGQEEPVENAPVSAFDFDFELYSLTVSELRELIYNEIQLYHSDEAVDKYLELRAQHPNGMLFQYFPKERMRTMYKTGAAPDN